jgi:hypothetical protein
VLVGVLSTAFFFFFFLQHQGLNSEPTPWATPPALFCDGYFQDRVSQTICPGWLRIEILLIFASWVARIAGVSHWHLAEYCVFVRCYYTSGDSEISIWPISTNTEETLGVCMWELNFSSFFFFGSTSVWTQDFALLGRHSIIWATPPSLFCSVYFGDRVLLFA